MTVRVETSFRTCGHAFSESNRRQGPRCCKGRPRNKSTPRKQGMLSRESAWVSSGARTFYGQLRRMREDDLVALAVLSDLGDVTCEGKHLKSSLQLWRAVPCPTALRCRVTMHWMYGASVDLASLSGQQNQTKHLYLALPCLVGVA